MKRFGPYILDTPNECLWLAGARIALQPKPFAVLRYLVDHAGRLITHDEFMEALWPDTFVQPQVLRTYMLELRKTLRDDAHDPKYIRSLPKRGYQFIARVSDGEAESTSPAHLANEDGLIGRAAEAQQLEDALRRTKAGQRQIVFVCGSSGIGKTAFVDHFYRTLANTPDVMIARGQCIQALAGKEQYHPWIEALSDLCAGIHAEPVCAVLTRTAPAWLAALGRSSPSSPEARARSAGELCAAVEELARDITLVLLIEDIQWADSSTLDLLSTLAWRRAAGRLLVVATFNQFARCAVAGVRHLKQDLLMRRLASEVNLGPLARGEMSQVLARRLGGPVSDELTSCIYERAEGNPLFANAIAEHLLAHGAIAQRTDERGLAAWHCRNSMRDFDASIPDKIALLIELEIQELDPREQQLLEAASLFPVAFPAWGVAAALGEPLAQVEEECNAAVARLHFVRRAGLDELPDQSLSAFYTFSHGHYREILYHRQPGSRRAECHTRIAGRLAELFAGREMDAGREMAWHYEAAGNWKLAVETLRSAARHARLCSYPSVADEYAEQAERIAADSRRATQ